MSSTSNPTEKKKRSANWEQMEKTLLRDCIKEYLSIIECKTCDTNTNKSKQLTWKKIFQRFNELNIRQRSMDELKQQWRVLKLDAKKNVSAYKRSLKQTGGGMKPPSPDPNTQEIIEMIPQEFEEDVNEFDSDNLNLVDKKQWTDIIKMPVEVIEIEGEKVEISSEENEMSTSACSILKKPETNKTRVPFKRPYERKNKSDTKERDIVLMNCIKEESKLKMKQMAEAHEWAREEHILNIEQLKLKNILLQQQIKDTE